MQSKITLYSDKMVIDQIKLYAKEHNISVSKLVNSFFVSLLQDKNQDNNKYPKSTITDNLYGKLSNASIDTSDYKKHLEEKYL